MKRSLGDIQKKERVSVYSNKGEYQKQCKKCNVDAILNRSMLAFNRPCNDHVFLPGGIVFLLFRKEAEGNPPLLIKVSFFDKETMSLETILF